MMQKSLSYQDFHWTRSLPTAALLLMFSTLFGVEPTVGEESTRKNFDARNAVSFEVKPSPAQLQAEEVLRGSVPGLAVSFDPTSGIARKLTSHVGYLTEPKPGEAQDLGLDFVHSQRELLGLTESDLRNYEVTDSVYSKVTGATHLYLRQVHQGIPVYNGQLHINMNRDGRILSVNNAFLPNLAQTAKVVGLNLDAPKAVQAAAEHLGLPSTSPTLLRKASGARQITRMNQPLISREEIVAELVWLPVRGKAQLVWNFLVHTLDDEHIYEFTVDAQTGKIWTRADRVASAEYRVYEQPVESPEHTTPLPPADARTLAINVADPIASPLGWHNTGAVSYDIMRGNNVHAFENRDGNNQPPAVETSCGPGLSCDFPLDLSSDPSNSIAAATANLFYWNNLVHDIQYQYGFDEEAGNFQVNNFGNGGEDNDDVRAMVQFGADGSFNCNATFSFTRDGVRPRMRMFLCDRANPERDGDFDNGVIVHEYGHGISSRQVGGPSNPNCLANNQQPGEGWSDFFALVYTAEPGDLGTDPRGIGSYLFNVPNDGTIRDLPYSTDPAVNDWTYESIQGASIPHGVGSRWAQAIWEVYWALVDQHGFDSDLYDALGGSGNQRALLYVNEGLKNTACSPTFLDARDGIIQAVTDNLGGEDLCTVWQTFADFGLGTDATTGGPGTTTATNGFAVPPSCQSQAPVCQDDFFSTPQDTRLSIFLGNLLGNDFDPDGDPLWLWDYDLVTAQGGTNDTGHVGGFNYTPPAGFVGLDSFSYTIADRGDGTGLTDTCTVFVDVTAPAFQTISDSFVGGGSLNGRSTEEGGVVWSARPGALVSGGRAIDSAAIAGVPFNPKIIRGATSTVLSADVDPSGSEWVAVGFANAAAAPYWSRGQLWTLLRPNGTYAVHAVGSQLASGTIPGSPSNGFHHVEIQYDTGTELTTVLINGSAVVSSQALPSTPDIQYAGFHMHKSAEGAGKVDNFEVSWQGRVVISDSFAGGGSLNGRTAQVGGVTWSARAGAVLGGGRVLDSAAIAGVPFDPSTISGTPEVAVSADVNPSASEWVGVGFADAASLAYWSRGELWVLVRPNGKYSAFALGSLLASGTIPGTPNNGFHHVDVRYDTATGLATILINGTVVVSSQALSATPDIHHAGFHMHGAAEGGGKIDNFEVRQLP